MAGKWTPKNSAHFFEEHGRAQQKKRLTKNGLLNDKFYKCPRKMVREKTGNMIMMFAVCQCIKNTIKIQETFCTLDFCETKKNGKEI